ncbi:RING-H2 finger protein ATL39-like [Rutidosis leptorrhynchoides]|uniref:RING-H2 finger protein ATL39-like n=1 Tax=Rutidosis leptorrhynchoides TaxID=125765 RepID=UPI003A98D10C
MAQSSLPPPPPPDAFTKFEASINPKMAVVLVILVIAFLMMGFLSVFVRRCAQRQLQGRYDPPLALLGAGRLSRRSARGLDAQVIKSFPTFLYSKVKGLRIGQGSLECAICLNEFEDDETLRLIPTCNHVFHPDCIDAWLNSHNTCPVCRANLVPKPSDASSINSVQDVEPPVQLETRPDDNDGQILIHVAEHVLQSPGEHSIIVSDNVNLNSSFRSKSYGSSSRFSQSDRWLLRSHSTVIH